MKTTTFNEILLRRRNKLNILPNITTENNVAYVMCLMKNLNEVGYTLSVDLVKVLSTMTKDELGKLYKELISCLKEYVGANRTYNMMYENFPMCMTDGSISDLELLVNAFIAYLTDCKYLPEYEKEERLPLFEDVNLKVIDLGTDEDVMEILSNLIGSKTSLSTQDKDDLVALLSVTGIKEMPEISFKENLPVISKFVMENTNSMDWFNLLNNSFKTATDVLRLFTYLSDENNDISLANKATYKSMPRKTRKFFIQLLDNCHNIQEDMLRYKNQWIRIGEFLHVQEPRYKQYTNVQVAFDKLRNNGKIATFGGKIDAAIQSGQIVKAVNLLKNRPGELARMLDFLIRNDKESSNTIISIFSEVANQVSVPVLLQVKEHFAWRNENNDSRVFFPKGSLAKAYTIKNELAEIPQNTCNVIVDICEKAIIEQFKEKESMNKVYIADCLKNYCIPQSQRSASKVTTKVITRGSRLPLRENAKAARAFIWWTNMDDSQDRWDRGRIDIDLSAAILDENFNYLEHVSYTHLRSDRYKAYHSGDITNGGSVNGNGVSEFLDVDIDSVVKYGGRYVIYQIYSFTGQQFSNMPHAMFGFMKREDVQSGEVYEAKTVEQKMDLTSESTVCIPVIFDCVKREFIWLDMAMNLNGMNRRCANLEGNLRGVSAICYGIVNGHKPNMYDLAVLNAMARGTVVTDRNDADVIFDIDTTKPIETITKIIEVQNEQGEVIDTRTETEEKVKDCRIITPWDVDVWMSEML